MCLSVLQKWSAECILNEFWIFGVRSKEECIGEGKSVQRLCFQAKLQEET